MTRDQVLTLLEIAAWIDRFVGHVERPAYPLTDRGEKMLVYHETPFISEANRLLEAAGRIRKMVADCADQDDDGCPVGDPDCDLPVDSRHEWCEAPGDEGAINGD